MIKIGQFEVHDILTGTFGLDGGAMFGVVPKTIWNKTNPADDMNRIDMALRSLVLKSADKVILIDTGVGEKWADKYKDIYKIDLSIHNITNALEQLNISDDDVTHVLLTHLHFDHTGGSTIMEEGEIKPRFKNAQYYCSKKNWEWANNPSDKDRASYIKENFIPIYENNQLNFVDNFADLEIKEISSHNSDGHTIGMQLPIIDDGQTGLIYLADLVPMSAHLKLPYVMGYDIQPLITIEEKRELLAMIKKNDWLICFEHDLKNGISRLDLDDRGNYIIC